MSERGSGPGGRRSAHDPRAGAQRARPAVPRQLDAIALFDSLAEKDIDYIVIGGFAVGAHGHIRATEDLDICPNPEDDNLRRLADLLVEIEAEPIELDESTAEHDITHDLDGLRGGGNFRLMTEFGGFDVMQHVRPFEDATWDRLDRNAQPRRFSGNTIRICSFEDLLEMKESAGRDQDLSDVRSLKAGRREA